MLNKSVNITRYKRFHSERGEGSAGVILYAGVFAVLCFVFNFIVGWIYDTKEARTERQIQRGWRGQIIYEKPKYGLGTYSVTFDSSGNSTIDNL